ncbi:MAG TPA: response regulator [Fimbriimonas sp.]
MISTPRRILILLGGFALAFGGVLVYHARHDASSAGGLHNRLTQKQADTVTHLIDLEASLLSATAKDFAVWDDMVGFVRKPDPHWAVRSLRPRISAGKVDALWVFDERDRFVSVVALAPDRGLSEHRPKVRYLPSHRQAHYYERVQGVLTEFYATGIYPSGEDGAPGKRSGTLLVARVVGGSMYDRLELILNGTRRRNGDDFSIDVVSPTESHIDTEKTQAMGLVTCEVPLKGLDGKTIAKLQVTQQRPELQEASRKSSDAILVTASFGVLTLLMMLYALHVWVGLPVFMIVKALETDDLSLLSNLKSSRSDFGRLAHRLHSLIEQQRDVAKAKEAAETATRVKSEFLANMSHEIRTPMHGIMGMGRMLLEEDLPPRARSCADTLLQSAESLIQIVNDILDLSRIEARKLQLINSEFDPVTVVEDVCRLFAPTAAQNRVRILWDADPGVPDRIVGDAGRIRQVLSNLVGNSIKFTPKGHVLVRILMRQEGIVGFEVHDTGIGIPSDRLDAIFNSFTQAEGGTSRRYGGSGLGLTISKNLVELMGGGMSVESTDGVGSVFRFWVRPERILASDSPKPLENRRIYLADLDEIETAALMHVLSSLGAQPTLDHLPSADVVILGPDASIPASSTARVVRMVRFNRVTDQDETRLEMPFRREDLVGAITDAKRIDAARRLPGQQPFLTVLIAEDNLVNQKLAKWHLERLGCIVKVASNGQECLDMWVRNSFDLILMDVQMPELSGLDACRFIRRAEGAEKHTPIVALTASALVEDRDVCLEAGMDAFIAKPFREQELRRVLTELSLLDSSQPIAAVHP